MSLTEFGGMPLQRPMQAPKDSEEAGIAVVGGGPAGLAAAELLAESGHPVTVYERMPSVGRKLLMAGRGGLNLTHSEPRDRFLERYHPRHPLLIDAIESFPPEALRAWCDGLGQDTFVGSSGRVFPRAFKASPLLRAWLARLAALRVVIRTRHRLVEFGDGKLIFDGPDGPVRVEPAATLLAFGGASWPRLGADGGWVGLLERHGITPSPLRSANCGFAVEWSEYLRERFAGSPLKRVGASAAGRSPRGEAVITRDGIEGGVVYALSRQLRETIERDGTAVLTLDLRPDLEQGALAARLAGGKSGDSLSSRLRKAAGLAPEAAAILREAHGLSLPSEPAALAARIKAAPLRLLAPAPLDRAISTAGGLRFDDLDDRFMLRALPGCFAAGEMLDWEAPTGGYLLQACFATGRAAAQGMMAWLAHPPSSRGEAEAIQPSS